MKFQKRPIEVEAIQWDGRNFEDIRLFVYKPKQFAFWFNGELYIRTKEGDMKAKKGDWVIKGVQGECYPCDANVFKMTYDKVG